MAQVFPGHAWSRYAAPEEAGFSSKKLAQARKYSEEIGSAAVMVIYRGVVLAYWGPVEKRFMCHSIRKSYLSALYGIHVAEGTIRLDQTLGTYAARGFGGNSITIVPGVNLVFVHRVDTWWDSALGPCPKGSVHKVGNADRLKLLGMILDAKVAEAKSDPMLLPMLEAPARRRGGAPAPALLNPFVGTYDFGEGYLGTTT